MAHNKLKSALIGVLVGGFLGPGLAVFLGCLWQDWHGQPLLRNLLRATVLAARLWMYAFVAVGPAACVLGAASAVLLLHISKKYPSGEVRLLSALALGGVMGAGVPAITILIARLFLPVRDGYNMKTEILGFLPLGSSTGIICSLLSLWLIGRLRPWCTHTGERVIR